MREFDLGDRQSRELAVEEVDIPSAAGEGQPIPRLVDHAAESELQQRLRGHGIDSSLDFGARQPVGPYLALDGEESIPGIGNAYADAPPRIGVEVALSQVLALRLDKKRAERDGVSQKSTFGL